MPRTFAPLLVFWCSLLPMISSEAVTATDPERLLEFKGGDRFYRGRGMEHIIGIPISYLFSWSEDTDVCSKWKGVACNNGVRVSNLTLCYEALDGTLPESWSSLTDLVYLDLRDNDLTGTLPPQWSTLTELHELYLAFNKLTGSLPAQWSTLVNLTTLHLNANDLNGTLPEEWSTLVNLTSLNIKATNLNITSGLPDSWDAIANLSTDISWLFRETSGSNRGALMDGALLRAAVTAVGLAVIVWGVAYPVA